MEFIKVEHIPDLVVVKFKAFYDERGYFEETFNAKDEKNPYDYRFETLERCS